MFTREYLCLVVLIVIKRMKIFSMCFPDNSSNEDG